MIRYSTEPRDQIFWEKIWTFQFCGKYQQNKRKI